MYYVVHYPGLIVGCKMSWHFFSTSHGKGEWDGASVFVKRALKAKQIHNPLKRLQDVKDVVLFLTKKISTRMPSSYEGSGSFNIKRYF
jgi:hypothetical protein